MHTPGVPQQHEQISAKNIQKVYDALGNIQQQQAANQFDCVVDNGNQQQQQCTSSSDKECLVTTTSTNGEQGFNILNGEMGADDMLVGGGGGHYVGQDGCLATDGTIGGTIIVNGYMNASGGGGGGGASNESPPILINSSTGDMITYVSTNNDQIHVQIDPSYNSHVGPSTDTSGFSSSDIADLNINQQNVQIVSVDAGVNKWNYNTETLSYEDLKMRLKTQLEYYFSRENLAIDTYLKSQMDNDQFVPIRIVANFNKIRNLTSDLDLIVKVLRESPHVQVDEKGEKVRPVCKRCTLILREVPADTVKQEIEQMFNSREGCPKVISCEYAHNNSWYVNFDSDSDAQKAFMHLREMATFKGKPILARIKNAPIPRQPPPSLSNGYHSRTVPPPHPQLISPQLSYNGSTVTGVNVMPALMTSTHTDTSVPTTSTTYYAAASTTSTNNNASSTVALTTVGGGNAHQQPLPNVLFYSAVSNGNGVVVSSANGGNATVITSPLISPAAWTTANPAAASFFDLGHILAVNGFQPQGTYRPGLQVLMPTPLTAPASAPVNSHYGDRRNNRRQGNYSSHMNSDRNNGGEFSRRPHQYHQQQQPGSNRHYGNNNNNNSSSGMSNGWHHHDQRSSTFYNRNDNIHYNNIRSVPNNRSYNNGGYSNYNNMAGGSSGERNGGGGGGRYVREPRSSADYWSSKDANNSTSTTNTTATATTNDNNTNKNSRNQKKEATSSTTTVSTATVATTTDDNNSNKIGRNQKKDANTSTTATSITPTPSTTNNNVNINKSGRNQKVSASNTVEEKKPDKPITTTTESFDFQPSSFPPLTESTADEKHEKMSYADMAARSANAAAQQCNEKRQQRTAAQSSEKV